MREIDTLNQICNISIVRIVLNELEHKNVFRI